MFIILSAAINELRGSSCELRVQECNSAILRLCDFLSMRKIMAVKVRKFRQIKDKRRTKSIFETARRPMPKSEIDMGDKTKYRRRTKHRKDPETETD